MIAVWLPGNNYTAGIRNYRIDSGMIYNKPQKHKNLIQQKERESKI